MQVTSKFSNPKISNIPTVAKCCFPRIRTLILSRTQRKALAYNAIDMESRESLACVCIEGDHDRDIEGGRQRGGEERRGEGRGGEGRGGEVGEGREGKGREGEGGDGKGGKESLSTVHIIH